MPSLASNSLLLTTSNILNAALGFSLSLIIGRGLGESGFGIWVFCLAWASILTMICEFGLNSFLTREVSRMPEITNRLLAMSLILKIIFVLVLGGGVWFLAPILALTSESSEALRVSMLIVVASVMYGSFTAIFRSSGWMSPILGLSFLGGITQVLWSLWILRSGGGVLTLIWAALVIDFGQLLAAIFLWWNRFWPHGGRLEFLPVDMTQMVKGTLPFAISAFLGAIEARSNVLLLGYLSGETEVGRFGMASRFFEAARLIPNGIFDAAFPAFAAQKSGNTNIQESFRRFSRFILLYTGAATLLLILFARQIIYFTYGATFVSATTTLSLLGIALLPTLHNAVMEVYLYATGDESYATKLSFLGLIAQILASLPLIHFYGASGAAVGVLIGELVIWLPLQWRIKKLSFQ